MSDTEDRHFRECVFALMARLRSMPDGEYLQCLVAYYAAPTWQGLKPATLIRPVREGRDLAAAFAREKARLTRMFGVEFADFRNQAGDLLLLIYRPGPLRSALAGGEAETLLREAGYEAPAADLEAHLRTLWQKCACRRFPHEIGVFLGYPARDVKRFMADGGGRCPAASRSCWRAYGDQGEAMSRSRCYRRAKHRAAELIVGGADLGEMACALGNGAA